MKPYSLHIVGIEADNDPITNVSFAYRKETVYRYFNLRQFGVRRCFKQDARRRPVYEATSKGRGARVVYVTGSSHGGSDAFTGYNDDSVIYACKKTLHGTRKPNFTRYELKEKMAHLLCCATAVTLGKEFVRRGCRAFFGYDATYLFVRDETVGEVLSCDAEIDFTLADGGTAQQAHTHTIRIYNAAINALLAKGRYLQAACLAHNRDALCSPVTDSAYGDPGASLYSSVQ
jgi:hypothetical protein